MTDGGDRSFDDLLRAIARAPEVDPRALGEADLVGRTLGHFRVVARLGSGGMGVVYKAEDLRLHRTVALKVLSANVAREDRRGALLDEARAAAAVRDPRIAAVYEAGEAEGVAFIAMEYVEGATLGARLDRGPLPVPEAVALATSIARGLSRAHDAGVVHRDLKPDNVMIGLDGAPKILDFGLAGAGEAGARGRCGTPAYMSPEQAAGRAAGARSDVFSFGVVAYEMLSGARPFEALLSAGPGPRAFPPPAPLRARNERVPRAVERIVMRCLSIDPEARFADGGALVASLELAVARQARRRRRARLIALGALASLGLAAAWGVRARAPSVVPTVALRRLTANVPEVPILHAALSPDGAELAYVDPTGLTVQRIGGARTRRIDLPGGQRPSLVDWFPSGDALAVVVEDAAGKKTLLRVPFGGGPPVTLGEGAYSGLRVSPDGARIAFAETDRVLVMDAVAGALPRELVHKTGGCFISELSWAPPSRLAARGSPRLAYASLCFDSLAASAIESVALDGRPPVVVVADPRLFNDSARAGVLWTRHDEILYPLAEWLPAESGSNLYRVGIDRATGRPRGAPRALTSWVGTSASVLSASASGDKIAFIRFELQADVFVGELSQGGARLSTPWRLTLTDRNERPSAWSKDGRGVFFFSDRTGNFDIFYQDIAGGAARAVAADTDWETLPQVTPDGASLLYWRFPPAAAGEPVRPDLYRAPLPGGGGATRLLTASGVSNPAGVGRPQPWEMRLRCPRGAGSDARRGSCVLSEQLAGDLVFTAVDPERGRGATLLRLVHPTAASGLWDVSPDGARVAIPTANGPVRIFALDARVGRTVDADRGPGDGPDVLLAPGCDPLVPAFSADGRGLFVSAECASDPPFRLYYRAIGGELSLLWQDPPNYLLEPEPSPDGEHLAIAVKRSDNDVWMFEMP